MASHAIIRPLTALLFVGGLAATASAQTPSNPNSAARPQPSAPNMQAPQTTVPEKVAPDATGSTGTLSEKLDRSDGVIKPGDVDPGMATAAPGAGSGSSMPVIRPPGSAGGNSDVQPK